MRTPLYSGQLCFCPLSQGVGVPLYMNTIMVLATYMDTVYLCSFPLKSSSWALQIFFLVVVVVYFSSPYDSALIFLNTLDQGCSGWILAWFYWLQLLEPELSINTHYDYQDQVMITIIYWKMTKLQIPYRWIGFNANVLTQHVLATCLEQHMVSWVCWV